MSQWHMYESMKAGLAAVEREREIARTRKRKKKRKRKRKKKVVWLDDLNGLIGEH